MNCGRDQDSEVMGDWKVRPGGRSGVVSWRWRRTTVEELRGRTREIEEMTPPTHDQNAMEGSKSQIAFQEKPKREEEEESRDRQWKREEGGCRESPESSDERRTVVDGGGEV
jgi:hypothetical protein